MNINITQSKESQKRKNEIYWNFKWRQYLNNIRILILLAFILIFGGVQNIFLDNEKFEKSSEFNKVSTYSLIVISILFIVFCIFQLRNYKREKRIFNEKIKDIPESNVVINQTQIKFESKLSNSIINWNTIKNFSIIDDCLFLTQFNDKRNFEIIIDLKSVNQNQKKELISFMLEKK